MRQSLAIVDPLAVLDKHIKRLSVSSRNAKRTGIDTLFDLRRAQIRALNDLRRDLLGRTF